MSSTTHKLTCEVPPEEVARRIAEWRRISYECRGRAVIVYPAEQRACPWPGCGRVISGIDFQLHQLGAPEQIENWMAAWWQGDGLVGPCPACGRYVQYGYFEKRPIHDPAAHAREQLPDDWFRTAIIAPPLAE